MKDARIVFMGTPDIAVPILKKLIDYTNVVLVVTQPDAYVGRKKVLRKSPIKLLAEEHNIEVFQPNRIRKEFDRIKALEPDLIVTCAYGQIIPQEVLDIPKCGAVNIHASLLPKYRGAAPIQWAILNGEKETGVTLMYMDAGMDTGDMIAKKVCPINSDDNVGTIHDKLGIIGSEIIIEYLPSLIDMNAPREKQNNEEVTYAPMIERCDEHLNFNEPGNKIINKIKALSPWPLSYFVLDNQEIKVIDAEFKKKNTTNPGVITEIDKKVLGIDCLDGIIYLKVIKPVGKKEMSIINYLNGINKENIKGKKVN